VSTKKIIMSIACLIAFSSLLFAQASKGTEPKIQVDAVNQNVDIDFTRTNVVYNLLVHINDSTGITVFLDNQYQFTGHYKKSIDMKKQKKGTYFIEIVEDNKHTNKKIVLK
jgi:hypothetical protein